MVLQTTSFLAETYTRNVIQNDNLEYRDMEFKDMDCRDSNIHVLSPATIPMVHHEPEHGKPSASTPVIDWKRIDFLRRKKYCLNCENGKWNAPHSFVCNTCLSSLDKRKCFHCLDEVFVHRWLKMAMNQFGRFVCLSCTRNLTEYGEPRMCPICQLSNSFGTSPNCTRCSSYIRVYGLPVQCEECKITAAFRREKEKMEKIGNRLLCHVCTVDYKRSAYIKSKNRKRHENGHYKKKDLLDSFGTIKHELNGETVSSNFGTSATYQQSVYTSADEMEGVEIDTTHMTYSNYDVSHNPNTCGMSQNNTLDSCHVPIDMQSACNDVSKIQDVDMYSIRRLASESMSNCVKYKKLIEQLEEQILFKDIKLTDCVEQLNNIKSQYELQSEDTSRLMKSQEVKIRDCVSEISHLKKTLEKETKRLVKQNEEERNNSDSVISYLKNDIELLKVENENLTTRNLSLVEDVNRVSKESKRNRYLLKKKVMEAENKNKEEIEKLLFIIKSRERASVAHDLNDDVLDSFVDRQVGGMSGCQSATASSTPHDSMNSKTYEIDRNGFCGISRESDVSRVDGLSERCGMFGNINPESKGGVLLTSNRGTLDSDSLEENCTTSDTTSEGLCEGNNFFECSKDTLFDDDDDNRMLYDVTKLKSSGNGAALKRQKKKKIVKFDRKHPNLDDNAGARKLNGVKVDNLSSSFDDISANSDSNISSNMKEFNSKKNEITKRVKPESQIDEDNMPIGDLWRKRHQKARKMPQLLLTPPNGTDETWLIADLSTTSPSVNSLTDIPPLTPDSEIYNTVADDLDKEPSSVISSI